MGDARNVLLSKFKAGLADYTRKDPVKFKYVVEEALAAKKKEIKDKEIREAVARAEAAASASSSSASAPSFIARMLG